MWAGGILAGLRGGNRNTHDSLRGVNVCAGSATGRQLMALTTAVPWRRGVGERLLFLPRGPSPPALLLLALRVHARAHPLSLSEMIPAPKELTDKTWRQPGHISR